MPSQRDLLAKINRWITREGHTVTRAQDEQARWIVEVAYGRWRLSIVQPIERPDALLVLAAIQITDEHRARLRELGAPERLGFFNEWMLQLAFVETGFIWHPSAEDPQTLQFSHEVWVDGLTEDRLFRAMNEVVRCMIFAITKFQVRFGLGPQGTAPNSAIIRG